MSLKLRQSIPELVLLVIVTFVTTKLSSLSELQYRLTESIPQLVKADLFLKEGKSLDHSVDHCTVPELSCDIEERMTYLADE